MTRPFSGSRAARHIERLTALLTEAPRTHGELMGLLHMSDRNVTVYVSHLRNAEPRKAYILRYDRVPRGWSPVFALGNKPDAKRPPRQTVAQLVQIRRDKMRSDKELHDRYKAKERARSRIKKAKKTPATWLSALGA